MSEFPLFNYGEMLPEHRDALMADLVAAGDHATALMLAATCREERARYGRLGYKWPFAAARLSAARRGYFELFKYLRAECYPYWCTMPAYSQHTWRAVCQTPSIELFRWYAPRDYFPRENDFGLLSWPLFSLYADFLDEAGLRGVLYNLATEKWGLAPYFYVHKRFGPQILRERFERVVVILGQQGTLADFARLDLRPSEFDELAYRVINHCNTRLLGELFDAGLVRNFNPNRVAAILRRSRALTVDFLELLRQHEVPLGDVQELVHSCFKATSIDGGPWELLSDNLRALITYAGWTLPEGVKTVGQCRKHLFPSDNAEHFFHPVVCATPTLVNAL